MSMVNTVKKAAPGDPDLNHKFSYFSTELVMKTFSRHQGMKS